MSSWNDLLMEGQIIKIISNLYTVKTKDGIYECRARGKFRNMNTSPLVGDYCKIDPKENYILELLPRKNELSRPLICNVDKAIIVTSVKKPDLSLLLLDKLISLVTMNHVTPIICFTKLDLANSCEKREIKMISKYYQKIGISVYTNQEKRKIMKEMKESIVVLTGQTGAGKSTLLNKLDKSIQQKTSPISESLNRGVHTTRHVELFCVGKGYLADTPGFSALDINTYSKEKIRDSFVEFIKYSCPFKNCMHLKERDCAVKEAVLKGEILSSRYQDYVASFLKK